MRVLIIGADGLLGHALFRGWNSRSGWRVSGTSRSNRFPELSALDILDSAEVVGLIKREKPEAVVMAAANSHVDYLEEHPEESHKINVDATLNVARATKKTGGRFVFFSTDYVFDGREAPYKEGDPARPLNIYGRQKREVEEVLLGEGVSLILRVSALFGWEHERKNFVLQVLKNLRVGKSWKAATDQDYNPTYIVDIAEGLALLLEKGAGGLLHFAGPEKASRWDIAVAVAKAFSLDETLIEPIRDRDFPRAVKIQRPMHSGLDSSKAQELSGYSFRPLADCLADMVRTESKWMPA